MMSVSTPMGANVADLMLRVHSNDLQNHIVDEVAKCLENGVFADLILRCAEGKSVMCHKVVMAAVSPFIRRLLERNEDLDEVQTLELPDISYDGVLLLVDVVYKGLVEATMEELKNLITLARDLYINIPVSEELLDNLGIPLWPSAPSRTDVVPAALKAKWPLPPPMKLQKRPNLPSTTKHSVKGERKQPSVSSELPLPPPLKRIREDLPHLQVVPSGSDARQTVPKGDIKEYLCPFCNSKYNNIGNFKQHMRFHENEAIKEERSRLLNEIVSMSFSPHTNLYTCEICQSTYSHPGNFKQHLGKHERETGAVSLLYQQKFQGNVMPYPGLMDMPFLADETKANNNNAHLNHALQTALADRVDNGDPSSRQYHCEICGRTFKHPGNYKQHMASHMRVPTTRPALAGNNNIKKKVESADMGKRKCEICDQLLPSEDALSQHKAAFHDPVSYSDPHPEKHLYRCDDPDCFQSFSREAFLARHKETFHASGKQNSAKKSKAETTSSSSSSSVGVSQNYAKGSTPVKLRCRVCNKGFTKTLKLRAHMKIHTTPEKYYKHACDICGKKFTRPQHVNRHKRLHTGDRPYQCQHCEKSFIREDKLREHSVRGCDTPVVIGNLMDDDDVDADSTNDDSLDV